MLTLAARVVALVLACGAAAQGDQPEKELAKVREALERTTIAKLQSDELATVAWGAHAAAAFRLAGCIPEVRKRLATLAGRTGVEGAARRVAVGLLDALIETDAVVPADELAPFVELGAPAIVLMAREPAANRASLLRAFGTCDPWMTDERLACGNLLAELQDADFVLQLLRGPWQLWAVVVDLGEAEKDQSLLVDLAGSACATGSVPVPVPPGFPPLVRHMLTTDGRPLCSLIAPGPRPTFLQRSWFQGAPHRPSKRYYREFRIARVGWLDRLLGDGHRATIRAIDEPVVIGWKDVAAIEEHARQAARKAEPAWRALVKGCVDAKLLTTDATQEPMPAVLIQFFDGREADKSVPLPPSSLDGRK